MAANSVGIMGGTFNPIHNEHIRLASESKKQFDLHKVLFIPSGESYFKRNTGVLDSSVRYEMTCLAVKDDEDFEVSDIEIKREGDSYTWETLKELLDEDPKSTYYLIVGADTFLSLDKWRDPQYIFDSCVVCVAKRDDTGDNEIKLMTRIYEGKYDATVRVIEGDPVKLSSSMIRDMASKGEDITPYVAPSVNEYIVRNRLYR